MMSLDNDPDMIIDEESLTSTLNYHGVPLLKDIINESYFFKSNIETCANLRNIDCSTFKERANEIRYV